MHAGSPSSARSTARNHRWWLLFPFVWQAGLAPLVNDVLLRPFGLPFPMVWQMAGIVLTSVVMVGVFRCDSALDADARRDPVDPAATTSGEGE